MRLFNISEMLSATENTGFENSFSNHSYITTDFLKETQNIANDLKRQYQNAFLNLHKESIFNNETKFSTFYEAVSKILRETSYKVKNLNEKALLQFKNYKKEYNLTEVYLGGPIASDAAISSLCCHKRAKPSRACNALSLDNKNNSLLEMVAVSDLDTLNQNKENRIKNISSIMGKYRSHGLSESSVNNLNYISYLDDYFYRSFSDKKTLYEANELVTIAQDINDNIIYNTVSNDFINATNNIYGGAESLSSMIDMAISSEVIPYPNTEHEIDINTRNAFMGTALSNYIEYTSIDLITIGYKANVLFEDMIEYQNIIDQTVNKTNTLKEAGLIGPADIIIAEASCDIDH